jgi:hypothetical protein
MQENIVLHMLAWEKIKIQRKVSIECVLLLNLILTSKHNKSGTIYIYHKSIMN